MLGRARGRFRVFCRMSAGRGIRNSSYLLLRMSPRTGSRSSVGPQAGPPADHLHGPVPPATPEAIATPARGATQAASARGPLTIRPRRLRRTEALRRLVREYDLAATDLIAPLFVVHG